MHREFGPQGLVVLSVSTDEPEDEPKVLDFLTKKGATFPNFLLKDAEGVRKEWDEKYPVEPQPMLWLFNRAGERVLADEGKLKPEQLDERVKALLAEK